jgi:hypothetical protein
VNVSRERLSFVLQATGLGAAVLGVIATPFFGLATATQWVIAGLVAVGLDVVAIRSRSDLRSMLAEMAKLVVLIVGIAAFTTSTDTSATATTPLIPPDIGPILLLLSVVPSAAGAIIRRSEAPASARA